MAILQGTMATGEVIPVQVNNRGQLVAEGLPGPPGPLGSCNNGTVYISVNQPLEVEANQGDWWIQILPEVT